MLPRSGGSAASAAALVLAWLQCAALAAETPTTTTCASRAGPEKMVVVKADPHDYYSWESCGLLIVFVACRKKAPRKFTRAERVGSGAGEGG